ncbi:protein MULTIPLE CHLOROPLAST DIVISION SITE 1 [Coffea eugenioides]|uniref:protein MULTIPLE CHLOROPLAST DIVISION SITE 1 n=1 Tax=Coffea eugenioides TaxID=49369 RepID=UPI000F608E73|nr:protein MULTIPLE CHLOROPLAST DIVISION SITE 1 [Coffea eugenioides]XP_027148463.1 protein MULTIPLE CHLOROPLAST DIVISION SITE 1 [Coffea eugenioides]
MASMSTIQLRLHTLPSFQRRDFPCLLEFRTELGMISSSSSSITATGCCARWNDSSTKTLKRKFAVRALSDPPPPVKGDQHNNRLQHQLFTLISHKSPIQPALNSPNPTLNLRHAVASLPTFILPKKKHFTPSFATGLCAAAAFVLFVLRSYTASKSRYSRPGSVADLVRRGQLRSDRRGISTPLKYEDPFNNPMVKIGKSNSTIEMCGKVFRLAPVTLTKDQQTIHQKRRSRAYQWKRPKVFLKEGDSIPPDVDPDTVRWIPANHPFATTASEINEDLAQHNVYQKHGVPFRIQAEHEALQRKLEALQNEQKLGKLVIDPRAAQDLERPFKSHLKPEEPVERSSSKHTNPDSAQNPFLDGPASDEEEKP